MLPFEDVKSSDWFAKAVEYVYSHDIFSGTSATTFTPNVAMTRGMFVTVLGRMSGVDPGDHDGETTFSDVQPAVSYAPYVQWAAQYGIAADNQGLIEGCSVQGSLQMDGLSAYVPPDSSSNYQCVALDGYLGGIAALNTGAIARCRNSGSVKNGQYTGGIAARSTGGAENCFNTGTVAAIAPTDDACSYGGGICSASSGSVRACYPAGRIPFPGDDPCIAQNTGSVQNCYFYDRPVSDVDGGLSDGQMRAAASYDGFDFDAVWEFDDSTGYPFPMLQNAPRFTAAQDIANFGGGSEQPWDAYLVSTAEHLSNICLFPDACFRLTDDISVTAADYGEPFDFSGVLDGGGCRVSVTFPKLQARSSFWETAA